MDDPFDVVKLFTLAVGAVLVAALWSTGVHLADKFWARGDEESDLAHATSAAFGETDKQIKKLRRQIKALEAALDKFEERLGKIEEDLHE